MENNMNTGVLFNNFKHNDRQPDFRGGVNVNGVEYEIAAWKRTSQGGKEYYSLSISLPRQAAQPQQYAQPRPQQNPYYGQQAPRPQQASRPAMPPQPQYQAPSTLPDMPAGMFPDDNVPF